MADVTAIHALCSGLAQHLSRAYQLRPIAGLSCKFEPAGVTELKKLDGQDTKLTLMVWRIGHNEQLRNRPALQLPQGRVAPVSLNVHLLLSIWADTAMKEQSLLGWVLRELLQRPVLDASVLGEGFGPDEQVPLLAEDLSLDELSKLWQVLLPPLRPSLGFVARNVMLELDPELDPGPVLARRIALGAEVRP